MKSIAKSLVISLATTNLAYAAPALSSSINYTAKKESPITKALKKFTFSYYAKYTGRSLSDKYVDGATYNRFSGGTSQSGKRFDTTGSTQLYQSFKLGYKLPHNMIVTYGVTYQDNLTKDVKYKTLDGDTAIRSNGRSYNNHRVALWIPSILSGNAASLSMSIFYELPTNKATRTINESAYGGKNFDKIVATSSTEVDLEYQYGYGFQPTLSIYSSIPGLYHGLTASYQKYVYPQYVKTVEKDQFWCQRINNCKGIPKYTETYNIQGVKANIGGYLSYVLTNKVTLKSSVQFDYDQVGKQVGTFNKWGNNMDNIGNLGASYLVKNGFTFEGGVSFSLEEASLDRTALFGALSLSI